MTGSEEAEQTRDRHQRAVAGGLGAGAGAIVGGPIGAVAGGVLGPLLEPFAQRVWEEVSAAGRRRGGEMIAAACAASGADADGLGELISASDQSQLMAGLALAAATRTVLEGKIRTLGAALAYGLLATDPAKIDTETMIIAAVADIESPHLSLLELLVCWEPGLNSEGRLFAAERRPPGLAADCSPAQWSAGRRAWAEEAIGWFRPPLRPVVPSLLGTLQRHGLAVLDRAPTESEVRDEPSWWVPAESRRVLPITQGAAPPYTPGFLGQVAKWSPTVLGEIVYLRFLEAGTQVPDTWEQPGQAAQGT